MAEQTASQPLPAGAARRRAADTLDLKRQPGFRTIALLCLAMLYAPIAVLVVFSFNENRSVTKWTTFSLQWFGKVVVRRLHHPGAGGRPRPDDPASLHLGPDPPRDHAGNQRDLDDSADYFGALRDAVVLRRAPAQVAHNPTTKGRLRR